MSNEQTKPGYKTTEFWLTIAVNVAGILSTVAGAVDPKTAAVLLTVANTIYAVSRGMVKRG